jgi:hypothetical protein
VSDVAIEADHRLTFTIDFRASPPTPNDVLEWSVHLAAPMRQRTVSLWGGSVLVTRPIDVESGVSSGSAVTARSDRAFAAEPLKSSDPVIQVSPALTLAPPQEQRLLAFARGRAGDSSGVSGELGRMTYFSATTITTTGFGDNIPLTPLARALVGAEAVLG